MVRKAMVVKILNSQLAPQIPVHNNYRTHCCEILPGVCAAVCQQYQAGENSQKSARYSICLEKFL